jgi:hypothetical protein
MDHCIEKELRSTTLTIAILVLFILVLSLALARLLRLALVGLVVALILPMLARLAALLTLLLHIISHNVFLLEKHETLRAFGFVANENLVASGDCKGWEGMSTSTLANLGQWQAFEAPPNTNAERERVLVLPGNQHPLGACIE